MNFIENINLNARHQIIELIFHGLCYFGHPNFRMPRMLTID